MNFDIGQFLEAETCLPYCQDTKLQICKDIECNILYEEADGIYTDTIELTNEYYQSLQVNGVSASFTIDRETFSNYNNDPVYFRLYTDERIIGENILTAKIIRCGENIVSITDD